MFNEMVILKSQQFMDTEEVKAMRFRRQFMGLLI